MELYPSRLAAAQAAGISKDTWQRIEEGEEVRESTYVKVNKALGWSGDSCLAIAEGGNPVFIDSSKAGSTPAPATQQKLTAEAVRRAAFEAARAKMPAAPIGDIDAFSDELVEVLRRTGDIEDAG